MQKQEKTGLHRLKVQEIRPRRTPQNPIEHQVPSEHVDMLTELLECRSELNQAIRRLKAFVIAELLPPKAMGRRE